MIDALQAEHFEPFIGCHFATEGGPEPFTLSEVAPAPGAVPPGQRQPFILIFRGPPSPVLPERLRTFRVDGGMAFTIHVMPIHTLSRERQDYQAVFN